jgi:hypothetical protein
MKTQDIATAKEKLAIREGLKNGWKNESKKKAWIEKHRLLESNRVILTMSSGIPIPPVHFIIICFR